MNKTSSKKKTTKIQKIHKKKKTKTKKKKILFKHLGFTDFVVIVFMITPYKSSFFAKKL